MMSNFRRDRFAFLCPFLVLLVFTSAQADDEDLPEPLPTSWAARLGRDLSAPLRGAGLDILLIGSGVSVATLPLKSVQRDIAVRKPLGSSASIGYKLGFWRINAVYFGSVLAYGLIADSSPAVRDALFLLRATTYTALITTALKALQLEERPRGGGDFNSFPSGHASNAFTFAGSMARNHGWYVGVPAMAMAAFVGYSRLNDNAHYIHDVVFGATIGLSYAFGLDTEWKWEKESRSLSLAPYLGNGAYGVTAAYRF